MLASEPRRRPPLVFFCNHRLCSAPHLGAQQQSHLAAWHCPLISRSVCAHAEDAGAEHLRRLPAGCMPLRAGVLPEHFLLHHSHANVNESRAARAAHMPACQLRPTTAAMYKQPACGPCNAHPTSTLYKREARLMVCPSVTLNPRCVHDHCRNHPSGSTHPPPACQPSTTNCLSLHATSCQLPTNPPWSIPIRECDPPAILLTPLPCLPYLSHTSTSATHHDLKSSEFQSCELPGA